MSGAGRHQECRRQNGRQQGQDSARDSARDSAHDLAQVLAQVLAQDLAGVERHGEAVMRVTVVNARAPLASGKCRIVVSQFGRRFKTPDNPHPT